MPAPDLKRQCTAKSKTSGKRCARPAIPGGTVCRYHGGAAPQVQRKAQDRIAEAAMLALTGLEIDAAKLAKEGVNGDKVRYLVAKDLLDRAGYKPAERIDISGQVELMVAKLQSARKRVNQ